MTVAITAPAEDMLAQEVEVKNGAGVVVPVKPLDIAAGDETAEFEFVTAVKAADLKGVWTVNGQSYDLDLFNNLSDFLNVANQFDLNAALVALEIENVDSANMPTYLIEKNKLTVTAEELTVEDVQKLVDDVNAAAIGAEEEAILVEAIVDAVAANNQITTLQALENAGIAPLNNEWIAEYMAGTATPTAGLDTIVLADDLDAVQGIIDTLNDELVAANITTTGIDRDDLNDSKALIEAYATVNEDGDYVTAQFDTEVTAAQGAYTAALGAVNALQVGSTIDTIVAALEGTLDEAYNDLSNTAKVTAAEAFYDQLVFAEGGALKTPFVTLAAVKALL